MRIVLQLVDTLTRPEEENRTPPQFSSIHRERQSRFKWQITIYILRLNIQCEWSWRRNKTTNIYHYKLRTQNTWFFHGTLAQYVIELQFNCFFSFFLRNRSDNNQLTEKKTCSTLHLHTLPHHCYCLTAWKCAQFIELQMSMLNHFCFKISTTLLCLFCSIKISVSQISNKQKKRRKKKSTTFRYIKFTLFRNLCDSFKWCMCLVVKFNEIGWNMLCLYGKHTKKGDECYVKGNDLILTHWMWLLPHCMNLIFAVVIVIQLILQCDIAVINF